MIRSLLIKLAMLGTTLSTIVWIGSSMPVKSPGPVPGRTFTEPAPAAKPVSIPQPIVEAPSAPISAAEEPAPAVRAAAAPAPVARVDVNRATLSELADLPGIGPKLAQRVIDYRRANGQFKNIDDLLFVKGIGRKKLDRMRNLVTIHRTSESSRHKGVS
jgi:competence protein ComEA